MPSSKQLLVSICVDIEEEGFCVFGQCTYMIRLFLSLLLAFQRTVLVLVYKSYLFMEQPKNT